MSPSARSIHLVRSAFFMISTNSGQHPTKDGAKCLQRAEGGHAISSPRWQRRWPTKARRITSLQPCADDRAYEPPTARLVRQSGISVVPPNSTALRGLATHTPVPARPVGLRQLQCRWGALASCGDARARIACPGRRGTCIRITADGSWPPAPARLSTRRYHCETD